jgi:hypothetical protein
MQESVFDTSSPDSQGTWVEPIPAASFDADAYAEYCADLEANCARFWGLPEGVLVHRRFRVPQVFAGQCRDMELSLGLQLSALQKSMDFVMDVPNFLEPWYGIGAVAAAYGAEYCWNGDLAPATLPLFDSLEKALAVEPKEIADTPVGRHILNMIGYFLEKTGSKIPLSFSDVQSPLDAAAALIDTAEFYMAFLEDPEAVKELLDRITDLSVRFYQKQAAIIGKNLIFPGHGFASARVFGGIGFSDDNSIMLSPESHRDVCGPSMVRFGEAFGGFAFHSCGNWSTKTKTVKTIPGLKMVDAAFTPQTDPSPNLAKPFVDSFADSGVCVNARMVGPGAEVLRATTELRRPGMKLIVVTYCGSPREQKQVYDAIHTASPVAQEG